MATMPQWVLRSARIRRRYAKCTLEMRALFRSLLNLKRSSTPFSKRYYKILCGRLASGAALQSYQARRLGKEAMSLGLNSLDLARIHGEGLAQWSANNVTALRPDGVLRLANRFLVGVLAPIEGTQMQARNNIAALRNANRALLARGNELQLSNASLRAEVRQRRSAEKSLRMSEKRQQLLLNDARKMQLRLKHLAHQVLSAQEDERKKISRELHDEVVQTLTGINVHLGSLRVEIGANEEKISRDIAKTQRLVEKSVDIVHRFARDLRPALLDDLGLIPALVAYLKAFKKRTGLHAKLEVFSAVEHLSNAKRTVLYRVAQAALVNVAQHAHASSVSLRIHKVGHSIRMEIRDDGRAFDVERALDPKRNKRLGLIGMRERVEMIGGRFTIESSLGNGTLVSAAIPLKASKK